MLTLTGVALTGINFGPTVASAPVAMNNELLFVGTDSAHGTQVWESNGTAAGTAMLTSANTAHGGIHPTDLTVVGDALYFAAGVTGHGTQLWKSNGTVAGTTAVTSSNDGLANFGVYPQQLANVGGTLYFLGIDLIKGDRKAHV